MKKWINNRLQIVLPLAMALVTVSLWGCVAIYNSTFFTNKVAALPVKQVVWLIISITALFVSAFIPFEFYQKYRRWLYTSSLFILWLVLFKGIRINGMRGWFALGGVTVQPSELVKPFFIVCMVNLFSGNYKDLRSKKADFRAFILAGVWLLPLALQPDFGTLLTYTLTLVAIYWALGGSARRLGTLFSCMLALGAVAVAVHPYIQKRFSAFISPEADAYNSGWHILQNLNCLAKGGWSGQTLGHSYWTENYLPNAFNDSIFASLGEAVGFLGLLPIMAIIGGFCVYGFRKAWRMKSIQRAGVVYGLTAMITIQALLHISVVLKIIPPTGLPLPFFSYGGSSLLSSMLIFGLLCSAIVDGEQTS